MEVEAKPSFRKDLRKCPGHIQAKPGDVINALEQAESLEKSGLDYSKCESTKRRKYYRIRMGDWRIGIELKQPSVILTAMMTRGKIYKKFPPKK